MNRRQIGFYIIGFLSFFANLFLIIMRQLDSKELILIGFLGVWILFNQLSDILWWEDEE